jgi:hypothetical protein
VQTCPFVCSGGRCSGHCVPNTKQCVGKQPQTCGLNGEWLQPDPACPYVCTSDGCTGVCLPDQTACSGNTPRTCNGSGQWVDGTTCDPLKSQCDAAAATCKKLEGQPCASPSECRLGHCRDGYCCDSACDGTCHTCGASKGTCSAVVNGPDVDSCSGTSACNATGLCKAIDGQSCSVNGDCATNDCRTYYRDADSDGYGAADSVVHVCGPTAPEGYVTNNTDCCDSDARAYPGEKTGGPNYSGYYQTADNCGSFDYDCSNGIQYILGTGHPGCDASCSNGPCYILANIACGTCASLMQAGCTVYANCYVMPNCK